MLEVAHRGQNSSWLTRGARTRNLSDMAIEDEAHAIDEVVDRLVERFPDIPPSTVREVVEAQVAQFAGSTVRDFVPVLIEHEALELLRAGERSTAD